MAILEAGSSLRDLQSLLAQAREGDGAAFCQVILQHEVRLLRQAIALCREQDAAEDLVQQTLIEAWKGLRRYDGTCRFSTWLYAILLHRHHKWIRQARSRPIALASLPFQEADQRQALLESVAAKERSPSETIVQEEQSRQIRQWIEALPIKHRQVILLRFFEEATLPDMAAVLHCSIGTVKSRLHHALKKLRKMKTGVNLSNLWGDR